MRRMRGILCGGLLLAAVGALAEGRAGGGVGRVERLDPRFDALVPPGAVLEKVADGSVWTEGPLWDARAGALLFSDVPRNGVFRWKQGHGVGVLCIAANHWILRVRTSTRGRGF